MERALKRSNRPESVRENQTDDQLKAHVLEVRVALVSERDIDSSLVIPRETGANRLAITLFWSRQLHLDLVGEFFLRSRLNHRRYCSPRRFSLL